MTPRDADGYPCRGMPDPRILVADEPTIVYHLSRTRLAEVERDDAEAASAFHHVIAHLLGERVLHLMRAVDALQA